MKRSSLFLLFIICLLIDLIFQSWSSQLKFTYFAPFFVLSAKQQTRHQILLTSFFIGVFLDLIDNNLPFGFYTLLLSILALLQPIWRGNFFQNKNGSLSFSLITFVQLWTFISVILAKGFSIPFKASWEWFFSDVIVYPLFDLVYFWSLYFIWILFCRENRMTNN